VAGEGNGAPNRENSAGIREPFAGEIGKYKESRMNASSPRACVSRFYHTYYDQLGLLTQLGLLGESAA
jgi:hypothetical protein